VILAPTAAVAAPGRCAPGQGVTVVVDFGALGGGAPIACVPNGGGRPAMSVVQDAGFQLEQVRTQPGFVCAIDGKPNPDASCARTPPPDKYWGLFWADGSSTRWSYSSAGAGGLTVPAGGSIGWRWQNTGSRSTPGPAPTTGTSSSSPTPSPTKPPQSPKPTPKPTREPAATAPAGPGSPSASAGSPSATGGASPTTDPDGSEPGRGLGASGRADKRAEDRAGERGDRKAAAKAARRAEREAGSKAAGDEHVTAEAVAQEETPLAPASTTDDGGGTLTWVAGGATLLLAAAAGVLVRRRRG
jgi:hypothetical protein